MTTDSRSFANRAYRSSEGEKLSGSLEITPLPRPTRGVVSLSGPAGRTGVSGSEASLRRGLGFLEELDAGLEQG